MPARRPTRAQKWTPLLLALVLAIGAACGAGLVRATHESLLRRVRVLLQRPFEIRSEDLERVTSEIERAVLRRRLTGNDAVDLLSALSRHPLHDQVSLLQMHDTLTTLQLAPGNGTVFRRFNGALVLRGPLQPRSKTASGRRLVVTTNSGHATLAALDVLNSGGNAVDAAIAAFAMLWATDPANASPLGRSQWIVWTTDRRPLVLDASTKIPAAAKELAGKARPGAEGAATAPLPGNLAAIAHAVRKKLTSLPLERLIGPAAAVARKGFVVSAEQEVMWRRAASDLKKHPETAKIFLKPGGGHFRAGDRFSNPALGSFLERMAISGRSGADGIESFYGGASGAKMSARVRKLGGLWSTADLAGYKVRKAGVLRTMVGGHEVVTSAAKECWGHTLVEMLNILEELVRQGTLSPGRGALTGREVEALLLAEIVALADSPYEVDTLVLKPHRIKLRQLVSRGLARSRARTIAKLLDADRAALREFLRKRQLLTPDDSEEDRDTTSWTVFDGKTWVEITTSLGPWFGSKRAIDGALLAYSYLLASADAALNRITLDRTEQTPTMVLTRGQPWLSLGAAGSERIVGSIFHTLALLLRLRPNIGFAHAVAAPRAFPKKGAIRLHIGHPKATVNHLRRRGYLLRFANRGIRNHLGIVNAVMRAPSGVLRAVADPASTGTAGAR